MSRFEETVEVAVPVRVAYNQWTQFETFPDFMEGVEEVIQVDDRTLRWTASIAGLETEWLAEIVDQTPDTRIAWKSISGTENAGAVLFESAGPSAARVTLRIDAEPQGLLEAAGDALGFLRRRVHGDMERFKQYVEHHGNLDAGWRGVIHGRTVLRSPEEAEPGNPVDTALPDSAEARGTTDEAGANGFDAEATALTQRRPLSHT